MDEVPDWKIPLGVLWMILTTLAALYLLVRGVFPSDGRSYDPILFTGVGLVASAGPFGVWAVVKRHGFWLSVAVSYVVLGLVLTVGGWVAGVD